MWEEPQHLLVHKQRGGVGPRGLQVLHGIPLIDAALLRADAALIVGGPDERHSSWEVVMPPGHFAGLVKHLQGRPGRQEGERNSGWDLSTGGGGGGERKRAQGGLGSVAVERQFRNGSLLEALLARCVRDTQ